MEQSITPKSTKNQILEAYEKLLKQQQQKKTEEPKKVQEEQKKEELTTKAKSLSNEGIVKGLSELKVSLSTSLDKLGEQLVSEYKKFAELQQAIEIEKNNLKDLYDLSANTDSLATMLLTQKEQKEQFEAEMALRKTELENLITLEKEKFETSIEEKRALWKKEQEEQVIKAKEASELLKKSRTREEEEYNYNIKIERKKDEDAYAEKTQMLEKELIEKKTAFEKDFLARKNKIEESETELITLRKKNDSFPSELENAVADAIKTTTEKLQTQYKFETDLKAKEVEGEIKLKDQTIATLNTKIKEMEVSMKEMSAKTVTAESSVKDIALKAIESTSKQYHIEKPRENNSKE